MRHRRRSETAERQSEKSCDIAGYLLGAIPVELQREVFTNGVSAKVVKKELHCNLESAISHHSSEVNVQDTHLIVGLHAVQCICTRRVGAFIGAEFIKKSRNADVTVHRIACLGGTGLNAKTAVELSGEC